MLTRSKHRKNKQYKDQKPSSWQFYYVGPADKSQRRRGVTLVKTSSPLVNIPCIIKDTKTKQQCKRRTVIGCGFCWQHLKKMKNLRIKKSTVLIDNKSIGKGLFAIDTGNPEDIVFHERQDIIGYVGEIITERERNDRYGDGTGPYCIGGEGNDKDEDPLDTPMIDCALTRGVASLANHQPEPQANARYVWDDHRNIHLVIAVKDIFSGEEIFCDYGPHYQLQGKYAGKHATLAAKRPPPKWYRQL